MELIRYGNDIEVNVATWPVLSGAIHSTRPLNSSVCKNDFKNIYCHIRPQTVENWASRPLCHTQATDRQISSWVGDDQRIPAVVCLLS
jgi:hypothetical protein